MNINKKHRNLHVNLDNEITRQIDVDLSNLQYKVSKQLYIDIDEKLAYPFFHRFYLNLIRLLRRLKTIFDKN
jgi:hypothetical protein